VLLPADAHVEQLDAEGERHPEVDVSLADVLAHPLGDQHHADEQEEAQREDLHRRVAVDERADRPREREHEADRDHHRDDHHGHVLRHADRGDDRVEGEDHVDREDLEEDQAEGGGPALRLFPLDLQLRVDLVGGLAEQEEAAAEEDQVAPGEPLAGDREERRRQAHHPRDREQQADAHDQREPEPQPPGERLLLARELVGEDRQEDDVVDPEDDLHRGEREEADQGLGLEEIEHRLEEPPLAGCVPGGARRGRRAAAREGPDPVRPGRGKMSRAEDRVRGDRGCEATRRGPGRVSSAGARSFP
jgi:hypothetical protein